MKANYVLPVLIVFIHLATLSYSQFMYSAMGQNSSMFQEKGEVFIIFGGALSGTKEGGTEIPGAQIQGGVAVGEKIVLSGEFCRMGKRKAHSNYGELSFGRFWKANQSNWFPEFYLGTGFGTIKNDGYETIKFMEPFAQPSICYRTTNLEFGFSLKIGVVYFQGRTTNKSPGVLEPAITLRYGWSNLKFQWQAALSNLSAPFDPYIWASVDSRNDLEPQNFYSSLSLHFRLAPSKSKVKL